MTDSRYITVVNGLGERAEIPSHRLEEYKKLMAEFTEMKKAMGASEKVLKIYEIKEIIDD